MANAFFSDLLSTISERGRTLLRRGEPSVARQDASELLELCKALLSGRGEASGTAMARDVLDRDVAHLLSSWFNRGFLVLRRIDWSTPANILEQIIRYEAVHEIRDWNDLRRRIDPVDRRCYAFFHPQLNDEPLIFVEVALTETIPTAIAPLLAAERQLVPIERARTAVFY